jgi:SAM-dependent methyltransferase
LAPLTVKVHDYSDGVDFASGGWETWSWDESLFAGAARYYEQGRLPYAPGLADALARSLALDGRGRLLDVGCGPGTVTLPLAPLFEAVVGLDPDPEMLACASRAAAERGAGNATWVRQRAEALPAGLGSFRVVTFAQSFHWMDRPRVALAVATMLDLGGAVVQVDAPGYRTDELSAETRRGSLPFPPPPDGALDQLRRRYLGSDRRAGQGIRNTSPSGEDGVFQQAGFLPAETVTVPDQRAVEQTVDDVVARVFSTSSAAPHLFGDRQEDYERDLRGILAQASLSGRFSVRLPDNILRIWRLPALPAGSATDEGRSRSDGVDELVETPAAANRGNVIDVVTRGDDLPVPYAEHEDAGDPERFTGPGCPPVFELGDDHLRIRGFVHGDVGWLLAKGRQAPAGRKVLAEFLTGAQRLVSGRRERMLDVDLVRVQLRQLVPAAF